MPISAPRTNALKMAMGGGLHPGAWKKLDRLDCSTPTPHMLGLRCPIRLLRLDRCSEHAPRYVADPLRENPISRLKVSLPLGDKLRGLDGLCNSPEVADILTHLTLHLVCPGTSRDGRSKSQPRGTSRSSYAPTFWYVSPVIFRCEHDCSSPKIPCTTR